MANADFTFTEGIDPTGVFPSAYATVLLQLVREATPNPYRGMIIFSDTTPAVTGDYAWHKRCLWIKSDDWTFYFYDDDAGSWESLFSAIPADAITTAMVQDGAITLAKLAIGAGAAGQIIRINSGATAFEFVNVTDTIASGALAPNKLTPGTNGQVLWTTGGAAAWVSLATLLNSVATGTFPVTVLTSPGASSLGKFLFANAATGAISWTEFDLNIAQAAGSVNADMLAPGTNGQMLVTKSGTGQWGSPSDLANNSIPVTKLAGGSSGQSLKMVGATPTWVNSSQASAYASFNPTVGTGTIGIASADVETNEVTFTGAHTLADGQVVWLQAGASGLTGLAPIDYATPSCVPYYFKSTGATTGTLHTTKAGALDGSGKIDITANGTGTLEYWAMDPIKSQFNVDGIVELATGLYYVDFATEQTNANYITTFGANRLGSGSNAIVMYEVLSDVSGVYVESWRDTGSARLESNRCMLTIHG